MEQGKGRQSMLPSFFTKKELEIGDILIQNPIQLSIPKPVPEFPPRSSSFSPPLISHHSTEIQPKVVDEVKAPSPVTPLSFPTDEYDQETKYSSKKRGRKEQLTESVETLKGEVEKVKNYYNQLQAENIELKERKRKILLKRKDEIKNENLRKNGFINSGQQFRICSQQQLNGLILEDQQRQYSKLFPSSVSAQSSSSSLRQPIGPCNIPDLNVPVEETFGMDSFQPLDNKDTRIITSESPNEKRLKRRIIITKKGNGHR